MIRNYGIVANSLNFLSKFSLNGMTLSNITKTQAVVVSLCLALLLVASIGLARQFTVKTVPDCQRKNQPFDYSICELDAKNAVNFSLQWQNPSSTSHPLLLTFNTLRDYLASEQPAKTLLFAMNAGMYDGNFAPIGYTVINGKQIRALNLKQGGGNFHLMPNGVFWQDRQGFYITESQSMAKKLASGAKPTFATQSGPMLVIDGNIHPAFDANSTSRKYRNGVGVCGRNPSRVKFVISDTPVSFYEFADLFKSQLGCDNALFLDGGSASALYSQTLSRNDNKYMGVMIAVTQDK